jgi:hypothetical protein
MIQLWNECVSLVYHQVLSKRTNLPSRAHYLHLKGEIIYQPSHLLTNLFSSIDCLVASRANWRTSKRMHRCGCCVRICNCAAPSNAATRMLRTPPDPDPEAVSGRMRSHSRRCRPGLSVKARPEIAEIPWKAHDERSKNSMGGFITLRSEFLIFLLHVLPLKHFHHIYRVRHYHVRRRAASAHL